MRTEHSRVQLLSRTFLLHCYKCPILPPSGRVHQVTHQKLWKYRFILQLLIRQTFELTYARNCNISTFMSRKKNPNKDDFCEESNTKRLKSLSLTQASKQLLSTVRDHFKVFLFYITITITGLTQLHPTFFNSSNVKCCWSSSRGPSVAKNDRTLVHATPQSGVLKA